jgi:hypothetical protein
VDTRNKVARILAVLGSVLLFASSALHCLAYLKISAPAVHASNLAPLMQSVFQVAFLSMAWSWFVLAVIILVATLVETRLRRTLILICGFAVLIQAIYTIPFIGLFLGNEMIGAAALLTIVGGFLNTAGPG